LATLAILWTFLPAETGDLALFFRLSRD